MQFVKELYAVAGCASMVLLLVLHGAKMMFDLGQFVIESNRIENIHGAKPRDIDAHERFLRLEEIWIPDLQSLVSEIEPGAVLRSSAGMDVRVGHHVPVAGGMAVTERLRELLVLVNTFEASPFEAHVQYETIHPFMDGNGRSGRALWLWVMLQLGNHVYDDSFLHTFYYQTLENQPARQ